MPSPAPGPHYYAAHDLDSYPWPLAPLQLYPLAGERVGEVCLELRIDEFGIVQDVIFVEPARAGRTEDGLRAALAATRFTAARKDGRPVKSRVMLRVSFNAEAGGR